MYTFFSFFFSIDYFSTKEFFNRIILEDIVDKDDDNQSLSMDNTKAISSQTNLSSSNEQIDHDGLLERTANHLVDKVLAEILLFKNLDDNIDDKNSGVRELSDDENGLRELDENDMNDTDEFIVLPSNADISDHDEQTLNTPRHSLNRLYTFSKINNHNLDNSKHPTSNQVCKKKQFSFIIPQSLRF